MRALAVLALAAVPAALMAHPGHGPADVATALAHPWFGFDHLLAMLTVGALGWRLGGHGCWAMPAAFVGGMLGGALLSMTGMPGTGAEWVISGSVLALGLLLALPRLPGLAWLMPLTALMAAAHGYAHVGELGLAAAPAFLTSTALLHGVGLALAWGLARGLSLPALRYAGGGVAVAGLALLIGF